MKRKRFVFDCSEPYAPEPRRELGNAEAWRLTRAALRAMQMPPEVLAPWLASPLARKTEQTRAARGLVGPLRALGTHLGQLGEMNGEFDAGLAVLEPLIAASEQALAEPRLGPNSREFFEDELKLHRKIRDELKAGFRG